MRCPPRDKANCFQLLAAALLRVMTLVFGQKKNDRFVQQGFPVPVRQKIYSERVRQEKLSQRHKLTKFISNVHEQ